MNPLKIFAAVTRVCEFPRHTGQNLSHCRRKFYFGETSRKCDSLRDFEEPDRAAESSTASIFKSQVQKLFLCHRYKSFRPIFISSLSS